MTVFPPRPAEDEDPWYATRETYDDALEDAINAAETALDGKQPIDADLTTIAGLTATTDNVIQSVGSAWASRTPAQLKTTLALAKGDVGLGNVDNTADTAKPVSTAQQTALDLKQDKTWRIVSFVSGSNVTTTLNTLSDITGLAFAIGASETWSFSFYLATGCDNTGGIRLAIATPASSTFLAHGMGIGGNNNSITAMARVTSSANGNQINNFSTSTTGWAQVHGVIVNSTNAGTVQLRFQSVTSGQTSTVYANGSYVIAHRIS